MARKQSNDAYNKQEAQQRFEAALRGSRVAGPNPPKTVTTKRGRPARDDDPMPKADAEALIEWGKRNIQDK